MKQKDPFKNLWNAFAKKDWEIEKQKYDDWNKDAKDWYKIWEKRQDVWPKPDPEPMPYPKRDSTEEVKKWEELAKEWHKNNESFSERERKKKLFNRFVAAVEKLRNTGDLNKFLLKFAELVHRANSLGVNINKWVKELLPPDKLRDFVMLGAFGRAKNGHNKVKEKEGK